METVSNHSAEVLFSYMCHVIDLANSTKDCSVSDPNICISCPTRGGYLTGERFTDVWSLGHAICFLLWIITILVGVFGVLGNIIIVKVLQRRKKQTSFDFLLLCLASGDIFTCIVTSIAATCRVAFFSNWFGYGIIMIYLSYLPNALWLSGRSISTFITMLITTERYLKIAFPIQSQNWIIGRRTKFFAFLMLLLAIFVTIPRITSVYVASNKLYKDVPSMTHFSHVILTTPQNEFWYKTLGSVHVLIDFWVPLPYLLVLNFLSLKEIWELGKRRKELNMRQRKDMQAVQMFLPVISVLLCCNMVPIVHFVVLQYFGIIYNEFHMMTILSMAVNAAVNFPIYYFRAASFKKEASIVISDIFPETFSIVVFRHEGNNVNIETVSGTPANSNVSNFV